MQVFGKLLEALYDKISQQGLRKKILPRAEGRGAAAREAVKTSQVV